MINRQPTYSLTNPGQNDGVIAGVVHGDITYIHPTPANKYASLIPVLIEKLADLVNITDEEMERTYKISPSELITYGIDEKIEYNDVIKYKDLIKEYSLYGNICEHAFNIIDNNDMGVKRRILNSISLHYKDFKGQLLLENKTSEIADIDIIRMNADKIIDYVKEVLEKRILEDGSKDRLFVEDIDMGLIRIICYSFVECKILEKPKVK
ncbi:hypothetical protein QW71_03550 [Paenibacillus sp. IHB B 3415]|uniref:hypothetical protein n=1 Tax=Paenibacillus sp. IHB B 3415 TaxID=867080 RepID=UPI0005741557|nr:hypothetical protein [Paenibacillus sp. IHB B 3415]KHL97006.1 hypothetical protein QW71_03550 [Paenibacillus sp. IHB B 3415]